MIRTLCKEKCEDRVTRKAIPAPAVSPSSSSSADRTRRNLGHSGRWSYELSENSDDIHVRNGFDNDF
eukprot:4730758-Amphidinium_carterae.1